MRNTLITAFLIFSYAICISSETIELSGRVGKTITEKSKEYFGLFPDIEGFISAELKKDNNSNYFLIKSEESETELFVSDSTIIALRFLVDNFENILCGKTKFGMNLSLIKGIVKVNTRYNEKICEISALLRDSTVVKGYIIYFTDSLIAITNDIISIHDENNTRIIQYSDIYSIIKAPYPIIDGNQLIFFLNTGYYGETQIFRHTNFISVIPPEIYRYVMKSSTEIKADYQSDIDFDSIYYNRFSITFAAGYQKFNLQGLLATNIDNIQFPYWLKNSGKALAINFENYYLFGIDIGYNISNNLKLELGYRYETFGFYFGNFQHNYLASNSFNLGLKYTLWKSGRYYFEPSSFFVDFSAGLLYQDFYSGFEIIRRNSKHYNELEGIDIINKPCISYRAGINLRYTMSKAVFIFISGIINYHDFNSVIIYGNDYCTRYIDYIISYGLTSGFGINF